MSIDARLAELGITLPPVPAPGGVYTPVVIVDKIAYVSGQVPFDTNGKMIVGRVGSDRIKRILKVLGMVNSTSDFQRHPFVVNGFSNTMVEIFGDSAKAARSAVGMGSLPYNVPVEVEATLELHE